MPGGYPEKIEPPAPSARRPGLTGHPFSTTRATHGPGVAAPHKSWWVGAATRGAGRGGGRGGRRAPGKARGGGGGRAARGGGGGRRGPQNGGGRGDTSQGR